MQEYSTLYSISSMAVSKEETRLCRQHIDFQCKKSERKGKNAVSFLQQLTNGYWQFYSTNTSLRAGSQWFEVGTWRACSTARMRRLNKGKEVMSDVVSQSVATFFYYLRGIGCPKPVEKTYRKHIQRPTRPSQRAYLPSCLPKKPGKGKSIRSLMRQIYH